MKMGVLGGLCPTGDTPLKRGHSPRPLSQMDCEACPKGKVGRGIGRETTTSNCGATRMLSTLSKSLFFCGQQRVNHGGKA